MNESFEGDINLLSFDAFSCEEDQLLLSSLNCFKSMDVLDGLKVDVNKLERFLSAARSLYRPNPYHNYRHAVDVLQATYFILSHIDWRSFFLPTEIFALLVCAYCHDLGHPGCTNQFLVTARSSIAKMYQDKSVLENYHWNQLVCLLGHQEINILSVFSEPIASGNIPCKVRFGTC